MAAKRSSWRQSWDAVKYATELCQRSFDGFYFLSPTSGFTTILPYRTSALRECSIHEGQSQDGRSSNYSRPTQSLHGTDSALSLASSTSSLEKLLVPESTYVPQFYGRNSCKTLSNVVSLEKCLPSFRATEAKDLETFIAAHPMPPLNGKERTRKFRYHWFSAYRRLWAFAIIANITVMCAMIPIALHHPTTFTYQGASTATGANLMVAALVRQEHVVNSMFRLVCLIPNQTSLSVRKRAAKVYSYGGLHSGCAISAFLWYIFTIALIFTRFRGTDGEFRNMAGLTIATLLIFVCLVFLSHPYVRRRWHDFWELSHRFGGWAAIILVWAQVLILVVAQAHLHNQPVGKMLVKSPTFWFLVIITACLVYPWLRLRRRKVKAEVLSTHAVRLYFEDRTLPTCVGYKLSHSPLLENHGFATLPNTPDQEIGYSIIVSNAGDFTKAMITNPPPHIWTKGAPVTGVMRIATLFQRVIVVTTGSGIGPVMSFMNVRPDWPMRVIWSARSPLETYGTEIINSVLRADRRAIIVDTKKTGHPNLPALTYATYEDFNAEAVVVVSNPVVTAKVVFEMESRGVPAFGPIFDS